MIFTIQTDDEVAGLDITNALSLAGIKHTIISKQNDNAAQQNVHLTALRRGLASSIFINIILLAVVLVIVGGR